jgi:uncharacterized protein YecT (DUF1311 family)
MKAKFLLIMMCAALWWIPNSGYGLNSRYWDTLGAEKILHRTASPNCRRESNWSQIISNIKTIEPLTCTQNLWRPVTVKSNVPISSHSSVSMPGVHDDLMDKDITNQALDCDKASMPVAKAICSDEELSFLDYSTALAYKKALSTVANSKALKQEQGQWLKNIRNKCLSADCLKHAYNNRLFTLNAYLPLLDLENQPIPSHYRMIFRMRMHTMFYELQSKPIVGLLLMKKLQSDIAKLNNAIKI